MFWGGRANQGKESEIKAKKNEKIGEIDIEM